MIRADVSKDEECKQFVNKIVNHFGRCKCIMYLGNFNLVD